MKSDIESKRREVINYDFNQAKKCEKIINRLLQNMNCELYVTQITTMDGTRFVTECRPLRVRR